jgi:hypothetical protein
MTASEGPRWCQSCKKPLQHPSDAGWECECGVVVCTDADCYDEYFKTVAGGEGVRCRSCGHVT